MLRARVGLQLFAPDEHDGNDNELQHTAEHGEQGGTRSVGVPEGGEGEVHGQLGEHDTEEHTRQGPEIEDDLVEGGVGVSVGQGHIDVLEVEEGGVVSRARKVLGHTHQKHQGDVEGDSQGQGAQIQGEIPGAYKAVEDLQGGHDEQGDGEDLEPGGLLDPFAPEVHEEHVEGAVEEDDDVVEGLGHAHGVQQVEVELGGVAVEGELPEEHHQHGAHELLVADGDGDDVRELGSADHGILHLTGNEQEDDVDDAQPEGEVAQSQNEPVGQMVAEPSRAKHEDARNEGVEELGDGHVVGPHLLGLKTDVPGRVARRGDDVEQGGEEGDRDHPAKEGGVVLNEGGEEGQTHYVEEVVGQLTARQKPPPAGEAAEETGGEEHQHRGQEGDEVEKTHSRDVHVVALEELGVEDARGDVEQKALHHRVDQQAHPPAGIGILEIVGFSENRLIGTHDHDRPVT